LTLSTRIATVIARNEKLLYGKALSDADLVVINTVFSWYKPEHLERSIAQIRKQTNAPIMVLGNYIFFNEDVADMILRHDSTTMNPVYEKNLAWHSFAFDKELKALSAELDFTYISKRDLLCRGDSINDCPLIFEDKLFTYDRHHFSVAAAADGLCLKKPLSHIFIQLEKPNIPVKP
jgi:hypothetical protein